MSLIATSVFFAIEPEDQAIKRIHAHLFIADPQSAVKEAKAQLQKFPESKNIKLALLKALCESGREIEALEVWKELVQSHEDLRLDRTCLENLAWGVLYQGEKSDQFMIQFNSLIGTALTRDARAVTILKRNLNSTNALLRSIAISLASQYGDEPLIQEIIRLFKEEKMWYVKLEVIKAIGKLRIKALRQELQELIADPRTLAEEKAQAIIALVNMYEHVDQNELLHFIQSDRAGLRELACEIIQHLDLEEQLPLLLPLLRDSHSSVKVAALNTLGLLNVQKIGPHLVIDKIKHLFKDPAMEVAVTAAWVGTLRGSKEAKGLLEAWVLSNDSEKRRLASAALSICGARTIRLAKKLLVKSEDAYVKINLALGLIGQRQEIKLACDTLYSILQKNTEMLWMWESHLNPLFRSLAPSRIKHIPQIPNYPMVVDQFTRLNLLSILCVVRYSKAEEAVKIFLKNHTWGASGNAALTLLRESEYEALDLIKPLLQDSDEKIRIQAALLLALFGNDPDAVTVLQQLYPHVERQLKLQILEALANVGDKESISFLLQVLNEPFQVLRVASASALIQCLNH